MVNFRDKIEISYNKEEMSLVLKGNSYGLSQFFEAFDKYYSYDKELLSRTEAKHTFISYALSTGDVKQYTFYPDHDYKFPDSEKYKLSNIKPKETK